MSARTEHRTEAPVCPQCGTGMLLHFTADPVFRPIVACAECRTFVSDAGEIKTSVGDDGGRAMSAANHKLVLGCTLARHREIGIDAVVNARGGEQWRNDLTLDEIELRRDGHRIKDRLERRVCFYQVCSRFFRKHRDRIEHLMSRYDD